MRTYPLPAISMLLFLLAGCGSNEKSMDAAELTEFATQYATAWSSQDPASLASFYAQNGSLAVNAGTPSLGRDAIEATAREYMTAFPDMVVRLVEVNQEGRKAVFRWRWTGTNTGPDGTGNAVDINGYEEWTIDADGLIAESQGHYDEAEYRRQLNASARSSSDDVWWPSGWGADDERGAANRLTPEKVLEATGLIQEGRIYQLGRVYETGMPLFPGRHYSLTIPGSPTGGPFGENQIVYHDEMISGQIGQVGTQFDGLGHVGTRVDGEDIFYNGFRRTEFGTAFGLEKLGVEKAGVFVTRGVLIDVAAYKEMERLSVGTVITAEDLQGALQKQSVEIREGDVVLIHTGHGRLWMLDNEEYNRGEPGIRMDAALWLAEQKIVMTAADTWATEVIPSENPDLAFPVHQELLGKRGIYNIENLDLSELAEDRVYEFAFIFAPVKFKGATGSPGNPIAIK